MNLTIEAAYTDGVLVPQSNLDLPEDMVYQVQIVSVIKKQPKPTSLFGAFPELAMLADVIDDVKQTWRASIDRQLNILQSKDD